VVIVAVAVVAVVRVRSTGDGRGGVDDRVCHSGGLGCRDGKRHSHDGEQDHEDEAGTTTCCHGDSIFSLAPIAVVRPVSTYEV